MATIEPPAAGVLRDPSGAARRVMCRACAEFVWTKARKFFGLCSTCRRKGRRSKYKPAVESACVDCGHLVVSVARRKRCDVCRAERNRRHASEWYYRVGQARRTQR